MASEHPRGCGYRKINGLYLVAPPGGFRCGRIPLRLVPCPLCEHVPSFNRGVQRIVPANVLHAAEECQESPDRCARCPLNKAMASEEAALVWIGKRFYTPEEFLLEAAQLGPSKRINEAPKWLKVGVTWVFCAHEQVFSKPCPECNGHNEETLQLRPDCEVCDGERLVWEPGIFYAFVPTRLEKVVSDKTGQKQLEELHKRGITPILVPSDDPDHR